MYRVSLLLCVVPVAVGIIVKDPPPTPSDYKYSYNIEDPTTGDQKSQHEVRQGDVVTGAYTVVGPDGTKRTVEYTADAKHGFKAVLREEPSDLMPLRQAPASQTRVPNPVYTLVRPQAYFSHDSYPTDGVKVYFTPANEINSNSYPFRQGEYFIPTK